jgi:Zn-dependent protease with chaperone function
MRLEGSHLVFTGFVAMGAVIIAATVATDPQSSTDLRYLAQPASWPQTMPWLAAPVVALLTGAWLARLTYVLARAALAVARLPEAERAPAPLLAAISRTGTGTVRCIDSDVVIAFCAGARRPEIVVSEGLVTRLNSHELDAVLLHEDYHVRQREPLVRAAAAVAADVLFFLPLARWWSQRRIETAELRADQAAVRRVGRQPVASALTTLGSAGRGQVTFAGVAELRVAQLLGDPLPPRRPAPAVVASSLLGVPFVLLVAACVMLDAGRLLGS